MESQMDEGRYSVIEWSIDNFSCWNIDVHYHVIESPEACSFEKLALELYPRGLSGENERLVVRVTDSGFNNLSGELSYIGPDGSLLYRQQVDSEEIKGVLEFPPGPTLETVVAHIKRNEGLHKDRLIVRYLIKHPASSTEYMHTVINVFEVSLKIPRETLDDSERNSGIFWINCPQEKGLRQIYVIPSKGQGDSLKMMFQMSPVYFRKNLVRARMFVSKNDDLEIVKTAEGEHVFVDNEKWTLGTLTSEEMKNLTSLILCLKIIPSINERHSLSLAQFPESKVDILPSYSTSITAKKSHKDESASILAKELMCLYQDRDFCDFQLKCDNLSFPVHRAILSARSPVFKSMLSCDMREAASGYMDIVDLDPSTLGLFLTYLYTGTLEKLEAESALKLYYAADKYQVPSLKTECADFLRDNVSVSNVCDILSFANKHQDDHLIAVAHDFISNNYDQVSSSEEWKRFNEK